MKLLLTLILLPLGYLVSIAPESIQTSKNFEYEITVNSPNVDSAKFKLSITGFTLSQNGARTPFQMEKEELITPYKLNLKNGKYTGIIESKSKEAVIVSKVQGIKNGAKVGSASGDSKTTILDLALEEIIPLQENK